MRRNAQVKNFIREILTNPGRFVSILLIVTLGVAFFSGIRAAEPDMKLTGDAYYDQYHMYDGQVISTMGLTDDDVDAIRNVDGVADCEGQHSTDVMCTLDGKARVLHLMNVPERLTQIHLESGRLPEEEGEIVLDAQLQGRNFLEGKGLAEGSMLRFYSGTDTELRETLRSGKYTVVGFVSSPLYISFSRGSTTIGNGDVYGFGYILSREFKADYYSSVQYTIEGAGELNAFSDEYNDLTEPVIAQVEALEEDRCDARYNGIYQDALKEIERNQKKLDDAREKLDDGESELEDASEKLSDAQKELDDARKELRDGRATADSEFANALSTLQSGEAELQESRKKLDSGWAQLNEYKGKIAQSEAELLSGREDYEKNREMLGTMQEQLAQAEPMLEPMKSNLVMLQQQIASLTDPIQIAAVQAQIDDLEERIENIETLQKTVAMMEQALDRAEKELKQGEAELAAGKEQLAESEKELKAGEEEYSKGAATLSEGWSSYYTSRAETEQKLAEAEDKIRDGQKEIKKNEKELEKNRGKLTDAREELEENQLKIKDAYDELDDIDYPEWYLRDRMDDSDYSGYSDNAERMGLIGKVFPVLFFFIAALISLTTMTRMVEEERLQIGTMKALGYSKWAIARKYIFYALLATVIGSVIGIFVGEQTLPRIILRAYEIMYNYMPDKVVPMNWYYGLLAAGAAVVCVLAATVYASYRTLTDVPANLMRPPAPKSGRRIFLEKITFVWKRLNFSWKATMRNLSRYKKRMLMTVFGIGGCMALVMAGFGLRDSIMEVVTLQYDKITMYTMDVYIHDDMSSSERTALEDALKEDPMITGHMYNYQEAVDVCGPERTYEGVLLVPEFPEEIAEFIYLHDRKSGTEYELNDAGVIMTEKLAKLTGVTKGDTVTLDEGENGTRIEVKVVEICENYMGHYAFMTPALYEKIFGERPAWNDIMIGTDGTVEENQACGERLVGLDGVVTISYLANIRDQLSDMLGSLNLVIVVLIVSAGLLAFVVLYNLNNINITERRRELATIKVLGFHDLEVAMYVYRENIILTVLGICLGAVLGVLLHRFLITTVEVDLVMFGRHVFPLSYVFSIGITIIFAFLVNWMMFYKLKKINMVEALKSVE